MLISLVVWSLAVAAGLYLLVIAMATFGWFNIKAFERIETDYQTRVSVLVAFRNEALNIHNLLDCLIAQNYDSLLTEIIFIDDHSDDNTSQLIEKYIALHRLKNIRLILSDGEGKKVAQACGVKHAGGELIITTDADCEMESQWISSLVAYYNESEAKLIAGPVVHFNEKGIWQQFFSLDFLSLVAFGAGSMGAGLPFMGNAANMAFSRKAYKEIISKTSSENFVSGDDVFLIQKMVKEFGSGAVRFLKNPDSVVRTKPPENWKQFINQRIRWGSKAKGYLSFWSLVVPLVVFMLNFLMVVIFIFAINAPGFFIIYLLYVILKTLMDYPLLSFFSGFFGKRKLLRFLFPFEFIYPFYLTFAAFFSIFSRFEWKGRKGLR